MVISLIHQPIAIYEGGTFNIDNLAYSSEVDIQVNYYIDGSLFWTGFVFTGFGLPGH